MKLKYVIGICIASTVLFIGCGKNSSSLDSAQSTTSTTVYKTTTTAKPKNTLMDAYYESMSVYFPRATKAELLDIGEKACDMIDAYGSVSATILAISTDPDFVDMQYEAGVAIGSAIPTLCPEYQAELLRLVK